jgi:3-deoxy-D-manno-octulosonate 8-phosphate phosphatase (KDO 8-P phosphatase)
MEVRSQVRSQPRPSHAAQHAGNVRGGDKIEPESIVAASARASAPARDAARARAVATAHVVHSAAHDIDLPASDVPVVLPVEPAVAREVIAEALAASVEAQPEPATTDARLEDTRLVALDVDGVLTDGRIVYGSYGPVDERQAFHVHDGIAIQWLLRAGITVAWISGRGCAATAHRARELGVLELHVEVASKGDALRAIQSRLGLSRRETVAMGDDLPDLALRAASGFFAAPANAALEVRERAQLVTHAGGGAGAVRELAEHILRAQGRWQALVEAADR